MNRIRMVVIVSTVAGVLGFAAGTAYLLFLNADAGNLEPGAPPGPTMKTLDEIEPRIAIDPANTPGITDSLFEIREPGSYYLRGNVIGVADKHGIEISADNVTLDLAGFSLIGVAGSLSGVQEGPEGSLQNTTIRNGTVRDWGGSGVNLSTSDTTEIRAVRAIGNGGHGFEVGACTKLITVTTVANALSGVHCGEGSPAGVLIGVLARSNGGHGIEAGNAWTLKNCTAEGNAHDGITAGDNATIAHCSASYNSNSGVSIGTGSIVVECSVAENIDGIVAGDNSYIRGCVVKNNVRDGILVSIGCRIITGTITTESGEDGSAIHVLGSGNRIESCHLAANAEGSSGLRVDADGNLIIRVSATGVGEHYVVAAGNTMGPVIGIEEIGTNNNPHANYEH